MNDLTTIERAARGDIDAQRDMMCEALGLLGTGNYNRTEALTWAEFWGRVAMAQGHPGDKAAMLSLLALRADDAAERGDTATVRSFNAESIALVTVLADDGDEYAANALNSLSDASAPDDIKNAGVFLKMWGRK